MSEIRDPITGQIFQTRKRGPLKRLMQPKPGSISMQNGQYSMWVDGQGWTTIDEEEYKVVVEKNKAELERVEAEIISKLANDVAVDIDTRLADQILNDGKTLLKQELDAGRFTPIEEIGDRVPKSLEKMRFNSVLPIASRDFIPFHDAVKKVTLSSPYGNMDPEIIRPPDHWITGDNRVIPIDEMTEDHAKNALKMIMREAKNGATWSADSNGKLTWSKQNSMPPIFEALKNFEKDFGLKSKYYLKSPPQEDTVITGDITMTVDVEESVRVDGVLEGDNLVFTLPAQGNSTLNIPPGMDDKNILIRHSVEFTYPIEGDIITLWKPPLLSPPNDVSAEPTVTTSSTNLPTPQLPRPTSESPSVMAVLSKSLLSPDGNATFIVPSMKSVTGSYAPPSRLMDLKPFKSE